MWRSSHIRYPNVPLLAGHGWKLSSDSLAVDWYEGAMMSQQLIDILYSKRPPTDQSEDDTLDLNKLKRAKLTMLSTSSLKMGSSSQYFVNQWCGCSDISFKQCLMPNLSLFGSFRTFSTSKTQ